MTLSTFPAHAAMNFSLLSLRMRPCTCLSTCPTHASMHFTVYCPCACLYAAHCLLSVCLPQCISASTCLRMHPCTCLSTCPTHASMHFNVYFPCACLYAFHCLLSPCVHLCVLLCACPSHFTVHSLRTPLCVSLSVYFPYAVELCRTATTLPEQPFAMLSGKRLCKSSHHCLPKECHHLKCKRSLKFLELSHIEAYSKPAKAAVKQRLQATKSR